MDVGVVLNLTDRTPSIVECAPPLEERRFESVWLGEHTHLPVDSVFRYSTGKYATGKKARDGYVPDFYKRMPDPYVSLAAVASITTGLRLGTCIALPAEHNPIELAKRIATLDTLSGGRFAFGIGYGWNPLEMRNNGFEYADRRAVMREKIAAMKALWTQETAGYDGKHVRFTESWSYPKPVTKPHPPILLGAAPVRATFEDVVAFADGWIPVRAFVGDRLTEHVAELRRTAVEAGRDPDTIQISLVDSEGAMGGKKSRDEFTARLPGKETLQRYAEAGVGRVILGAPTTDLDFYRWSLDRLAALRDSLA
ncbi:LLM class F420-dependent oxidoreductase [Phytohabitans sp. ZYX-F-186]|uniref:LLM class F420-dependent oxidoreductase n=1 Tax=Phytohabitans maris TaxID=3071409 RepID=A0ABU0Z9K4_9ACTN|nr:LLM class F420-dependent oxidoreductase [Phytohabitans sp. ZYX-F-186]MDQ7903735.1 LLM class F420-dependent oxidoreductase [Phytohabitans sp. ZYX-F-186]